MVLWLEHQYRLSSLGAGTLISAGTQSKPRLTSLHICFLGLVFIGAIVPSFFVRLPFDLFPSEVLQHSLMFFIPTKAGPLAGWASHSMYQLEHSEKDTAYQKKIHSKQIADKYGAKWIAVLGMLLSAPTLALLIIEGQQRLFRSKPKTHALFFRPPSTIYLLPRDSRRIYVVFPHSDNARFISDCSSYTLTTIDSLLWYV